jgi:hypothetical protein
MAEAVAATRVTTVAVGSRSKRLACRTATDPDPVVQADNVAVKDGVPDWQVAPDPGAQAGEAPERVPAPGVEAGTAAVSVGGARCGSGARRSVQNAGGHMALVGVIPGERARLGGTPDTTTVGFPRR